ncbi:hypothetical protein D6825_01920 [Candidatus Woesearchaeota archaeon]|nr:MAG: hypothetical protein D6825_01920 [Candidatus Woesearchaeota archaeon]
MNRKKLEKLLNGYSQRFKEEPLQMKKCDIEYLADTISEDIELETIDYLCSDEDMEFFAINNAEYLLKDYYKAPQNYDRATLLHELANYYSMGNEHERIELVGDYIEALRRARIERHAQSLSTAVKKRRVAQARKKFKEIYALPYQNLKDWAIGKMAELQRKKKCKTQR